jgi:hypothetical protein
MRDPCPFCAGFASIKQSGDSDGKVTIQEHYVECQKCGAQTKHFSEYHQDATLCRAAARDAWAQRVVISQSTQPEKRRVIINGHQSYYECWFHLFFVKDGQAMALLELDDGQVKYEQAFLVTFARNK